MPIGKISKKSGKIKAFNEEHKEMTSRLKMLHEEVDREAKRSTNDKNVACYNRTRGAMRIENTPHHINLKDWSKSVQNWKERRKIQEMGGNLQYIRMRENFLIKRKVNLRKMEGKIINGLVTPQHKRRGCYKCKRLENICHAFFFNDGDIGEDWKVLINMMKKQTQMQRTQRELSEKEHSHMRALKAQNQKTCHRM